VMTTWEKFGGVLRILLYRYQYAKRKYLSFFSRSLRPAVILYFRVTRLRNLMKFVNKLLPNIESYHKIKFIFLSSASGFAFLEHPDLKGPHLM